MNQIDYTALLNLAWPEITLVIAALVVLALDISLLRQARLQTRFAIAASLASIGCSIAIVQLFHGLGQTSLLDGVLLSTPLVRCVQISILALTIVTLLLTVTQKFTRNVGEFVLLILVATAGMLFLVATNDLLVIFLSLETLSLSLYVLTAFDKSSAPAAQASLKYFLFGAMSAAFLLFGISLLYGFSNSTGLAAIATTLHGPSLNPLVIIALVATLIGFGFKVAAVPLHFWAPDVYQEAPAPAAAFIATGSKVASFFVFFQVMVLGLAGAEGSAGFAHYLPGWVPAIVLMAVLSMMLGNLVAIVQTSLRRLLAYSAIAHAGYMLLAIASHSQQNLSALIFYVVTYALATLGIFAVLAAIESQIGGDKLSHFDGLSRRAPFLSFCLALFLLSLAGIPPLAGFFSKFFLFISVLQANPGSQVMLWLVILAIAMSAVSLYYYLRVLKRLYVTDTPAEAAPIRVPLFSQIVIGLLAAAVVLFGCAPHLLLDWIVAAAKASGN